MEQRLMTNKDFWHLAQDYFLFFQKISLAMADIYDIMKA
jgi:hypothetical protein